MNLGNVFNLILYQPLFNALILLYQFLPGHDFGVAVIALTILIRLFLSPLMIQSLKSQKALSGLQKKVQEIQQKHNKDKEKQAKEIMMLYQKEKINPLAGFLPLLIQLPILIALYRVFWSGLQPEQINHLYSFVPKPELINPSFLGILDLSQPSFVLAVFAGISQFFQSKVMSSSQISGAGQVLKEKNQAAQVSKQISKQMLYFFPIFTILILLRLPAAVGLYWVITILFSIFQQRLVFKSKGEEDKSSSSPSLT